MKSSPHRVRPLVFTLLVAFACGLVALPAWSYVIILKDGSRMEAEEKYTVRDGRAYFVLPNGAETYLAADEIDVAATERVNRVGPGGALVIEGGEVRERTPGERSNVEEAPRLADLIAARETGPGRLERQRRDPGASAVGATASRTSAGFTDLGSLPRRPLPDLDLAADLQQFYRGQGVEGAELYRGTSGDRPFVEITTNSEASVFRALEVSAEALVALRDGDEERVGALEILLTTPERQRAGQFVMTPELAQALAGEEVTVARFFIENVQF